MSHEYRMEQLRAAIAAARKNFKKDANFFVVGLTYGCRRSCSRISFTPESFICSLKEPKYTVLADGNTLVSGVGL